MEMPMYTDKENQQIHLLYAQVIEDQDFICFQEEFQIYKGKML